MNILTILNKLKEKQIVPDTDEGITLFSDCFNKFGISLLLLKEEEKFDQILDILEKNKIPLQKSNGLFALRIFAVEIHDLQKYIQNFLELEELEFLRTYPEIIAEPSTIETILENMKKYQDENITYKDGTTYNLNQLLNYEVPEIKMPEDVNSFLKMYLKDSSLLEKLEKGEKGNEEEDFNIALELQKVENKICEEYLLPLDDGWKIIINNKEVNSFQEIKNTISTIIKLNLSVTFEDALLVVLFYKSPLSVDEIKEIIDNEINKGDN